MREPASRPTVCLSMIVRDEAAVVTELLESVVDIVDTWVIVDTGSVDSTREIVRDFFATRAIPGELHERAWRDFGTNRTEAIELCRDRADYVLQLDADDVVVGELDLSGLTADAYLLRIGTDFTWWRTQVFRAALPWRFEGLLHEYSVCDAATTPPVRLEGDYYVEPRTIGARSNGPDKYARDAELLLAAHTADPDEPRTVFYLAQSYLDAGDVDAALDWYTRRAEMGGFAEEVFYSLLQRARCLERLGRTWDEVAGAYLSCWQSRPTRAEPLYELARKSRLDGRNHLAYLFASRAARVPFPEEDVLFIATDVYRWRIVDELSISAFYVGELDESLRLATELLEGDALPEAERARVVTNRDHSVRALAERTRPV
jgi:glycosyltransferase involved in cell wall biosynthesis